MKKAKQIADYAIGDELWRHVECGGTFRFTVIGIRSYADGPQLEVECQTCSHGWKCQLLLAQNDYGRIVNVHMLNDDDERSEKHWHTNDGLHFWETMELAREEGLRRLVVRAKERVEELSRQLGAQNKRLAELEAAVGSGAGHE